MNGKTAWRQRFSDLGMIPVLIVLCGLFSILTWSEQYPTGASAARQIARSLASSLGGHGSVFIVIQQGKDDDEFADALRGELSKRGMTVAGVARGSPFDARAAIAERLRTAGPFDRIAGTQTTASWDICANIGDSFPALAKTKVVKPEPYHFPNFLKTENLLNIANQIAVIAIIAVGMTMVIITGGIDLSVGSLIALSSVITTWLIRRYAGAQHASALGMILCCLAGIAACAAVGLFSGSFVTFLRVPSFIVTLAILRAGIGLASLISDNQTINEVPDRFVWLGRGDDLAGIPNAVVLVLLLYVAAHILMSRMALGRYIYAIGGNAEAARLSGVPIRRVLLFVYALCGALAGLGGVTMASLLKSGAATYGPGYELSIIAAVVVGGTSLSGGQGKISGTLVGAFIIAVIQNGMNLIGLRDAVQQIVLGLVILAAVTLDQLRR